MRQYIELYIDNQLVEFREVPRILLTYTHNELHNPTVVKNTFSKTLTIDGTPNNNKIFNSFYHNGWVVGTGFDPSRKTTFQLYRNGEIMESGYVKLDKVRRNNNTIQYDITLYGDLGKFLYNLQYNSDGEKLKLSDLVYPTEFNLEVNKELIRDAWSKITGINTDVENAELYDVINFAPCYNGIPEDFTSNKVAIDVQSFSANNPRLYEQFTNTEEYKAAVKEGYNLINNKWLLGELEKDYDEWQAKDLRSYLQRPVIRFKEIIKACCDPQNNGGYEVDLDPDFFNDDNPYYDNAWMTLPLPVEEVNSDNAYASVNGETITIGEVVNGIIKVNCNFMLMAECESYEEKLQSSKVVSGGAPGRPVSERVYTQDTYVQLVVFDKDNNMVGGSPVKIFSASPNATFDYDIEYNTTRERILGAYKKVGDKLYSWQDGLINIETDKILYSEGMYAKLFVKKIEKGQKITEGDALFWMGREYPAVHYVDIYNANVDVISSIPVKKISKQLLFNTDYTPCDYFLSYIKMFNLHLWKDRADNIIYVRKRGNFFLNELVDAEELVDRSEGYEINPLAFDSKWLNLNVECEADEKLHKDYMNEFGINYGIQRIDTNYNFNDETKELLENIAFKGCITTRARSRYFTNQYQEYEDDDVYYQPYCLDGFKTYLLNASGDTKEASVFTPKTSVKSINWWDEQYYDVFPKPNFTNKDNKGVDGANVLLFYNGKAQMRDNDGNKMRFQITDDIFEFKELNNDEPCWIWSMDWDVAIDYMEYFPQFGRYITNDNGWVQYSWDFGTPRVLYIPDYNITASSSIYSQFWKTYVQDAYSVNTRTLKCKVKLMQDVVSDYLRKFYYFDGAYWLLNQISDYDCTSYGLTECTFIRINNLENYLE